VRQRAEPLGIVEPFTEEEGQRDRVTLRKDVITHARAIGD
jgi:hypothetical protein